jgi:lia operon protein LiaG
MKKWGWALGLLLAAPVAVAAQDVERLSGAEVAVYNLAGHVEVVAGRGADVVVRITRGGEDGGRLAVEVGELRGRETLRVVYPDDDIVYPEMGRGSNTSLRVRDDGTFGGSRGRGSHRVEIHGSGRGLEAWADLVIEVPAGKDVAIHVAAGAAEAEGVDGDMRIDTGSGAVTASRMSGSLTIDTGSGQVRVTGMDGRLSVDTGSGHVEVRDVTSPEVSLDTGSGRVTGERISTRTLRVDTGSGGVDLSAITSPDIYIDTGSGGVEVELTADVERLEVDTGSGGVTVRAPGDLGAAMDLETGSGGIDIDFPVQIQTVRRNMMRGTVGDGEGQIKIDTGSGGIRIIRN